MRDCDAVLTGYLPSPQTGEAALEVARRAKASGAIWLCDPVIGDEGRIYARPGVLEFLRERAAPEADILTPNLFELETLTGVAISGLPDARNAMQAMRAQGPGVVVCTSFDRDTPAGALDVLALDGKGLWRVRAPRLDRRFEGAGDLFAALFLAAYLETRSASEALARACAGVAATLAATFASGERELALIGAQDAMATAFRAGGRAERLA